MLDFLSATFMQNALIAGALIGFLGSYYGVFVVQRKMSFLGSGLSHAAFGGVALGILLGVEPLVMALPFTILVGMLIVWLEDKTKLSSDTSIGILFSVAVALGIVFMAMKTGYAADAYTYLFGSILAVYTSDLIIISILSIITIASYFTLWKSWAYATFDREFAISDGVKVKLHDYLLSMLLSLTVVVAMKIVGMLLIAAFLVIPAAIGRNTSKTFAGMTIVSVIVGVLSAVGGLILSFFMDLPSGAVIILLQSFIFLITLFLKKNG